MIFNFDHTMPGALQLTGVAGSLRNILKTYLVDGAGAGPVATLTVASGATACEGDEFEIYPPFGFKKAALDSGKQKIVLTSTASSKLKVVGRGDGFVDLMASEHALGVEE